MHRAYFNGYALWTYLTTPFLLAMDGVQAEETEPWREGSELWRVMRAYFPGSIETHSLVVLERRSSPQITWRRMEFAYPPSVALMRAVPIAGRSLKC